MDDSKVLNIREELENDLNWRMDEIRLLKNQIVNINDVPKKNLYRRSLVVMLYSHYEGFCNFAFQIYVITLNAECLLRKDVNSNLAAASMHQEFSNFESDEYKESRFNRVFGKSVTYDKNLFKHSKRIFLYDCFEEISNKTLSIPEKVVNTESNLWPEVLKKLLYTLGLPENTFVRHENNIKKLVNMRNGISHGQRDYRLGISDEDYNELEKAANDINTSVIRLIYDSLKNDSYLKQNS